MFDCHVHTKVSTDSDMDIKDVIKRSGELNIGVIITEHMDINCPMAGSFIFDPDEYFEKYSRYRGEKLLLGIEVGMGEECLDECSKLIDKYPFDYIIGSTHIVDGLDLYYEHFYKDKEKKQAYEIYLTDMVKNIKTHGFINSLGHIDYITRYARYSDKEIYYGEFRDLIDEVLRELIIREKSIEINTRRLNDESALQNLLKIYKRYYELGGRTVTIGSDAHSPNAIGLNFSAARDLADMCNLKMVYYKERKPEYV